MPRHLKPAADGIRRREVATGLALAGTGVGASTWTQAADGPVRIGYAIARTGPWAAGAQASQEPNYLLWAEQTNAAGGLDVKGRKRRIELVGIDDHSDIETCTQSFQKLMAGQHVDLILPPWGSSANFAVAPIANRYGYTLLAPTATGRKLVDMKLPYFFSLLQQPDKMMGALCDMMAAHGVKTVAVVYMEDVFGLEHFAALSAALRGSALKMVASKSHPPGVKDLAPTLQSFKAMKPDAFIGITYPAETVLVSQQARAQGFNPKVFYTAVGAAFPFYKGLMKEQAEGVVGMGSWNAKTSAQARLYFDAHVKRFNKEPDRWASGHCWAGLQILEQSLASVGLDRKALRDHIASSEFDTLLGKMRFKGGENASMPGTVGQWQGPEFEVVWPAERATAPVLAAKPAWT